jgi:hypothetical protein
MLGESSLGSYRRRKKKGEKTGLVIFLMAFAHAVFYFAPSLYLPLGLDELFLLGYALVLTDSGLVVFLGIKLLTKSFWNSR